MTDNQPNEQPDDLTPVMQFPMDFPVKIMGLNNPAFPGIIRDLTTQHFPDFNSNTITINYSMTKKYMAVSVVVNAKSKEQLDDFYRAVTSHPMVKVAL